ncbi:MAG: hypothetical protein AAF990_05350 [Bacteroidota bacterium]
MFGKNRYNIVLPVVAILAFSFYFQSCTQKEEVALQKPQTEESLFSKYLENITQRITLNDLGEGTYYAEGKEGTIVRIKDALVNDKGERVRGQLELELIEIYTPSDMVLARKQTLADYDGVSTLLESGGEIFVKVYQDGQEVKPDGQGQMSLLLPTENTGGPRENMELYYGQEVGEQVIWKPTGQKVPVVSDGLRSDPSRYLVEIGNILGWINVDIVYNGQGTLLDCIGIEHECDIPCDVVSVAAAVYINSLNSAFELMDVGGNSFQLCDPDGGGAMPLGGLQATFILIYECADGSVFTYFNTVQLNNNGGSHIEVVPCGNFRQMSYEDVISAIHSLLP